MSLPPEVQEKLKSAPGLPQAMKEQLLVELMQGGQIEFEPPEHDWLKGYSVVNGKIVDPNEQRALSEDLLEKERDGELSLLDSSRIRSDMHSRKPIVKLLKAAGPKPETKPPPEPAPPPAEDGAGESKKMSYSF